MNRIIKIHSLSSERPKALIDVSKVKNPPAFTKNPLFTVTNKPL